MSGKMKSQLAILMGIVIIAADLYWTYRWINYATDVALGVIIFIASAIWIYIDYDLMKK